MRGGRELSAMIGCDFLLTASLATTASVFAPGAAMVPNHPLGPPWHMFW